MFEKYLKELKSRLKKGVIELAEDKVKKSIDEKSPVDTGEYIKGNKTTGFKYGNGKMSYKFFNDSSYSNEVEYGFSKSRPVNWHKNRRSGGPVIYRGIGARVYTRTYDELKNEINFKLINIVRGLKKLNN